MKREQLVWIFGSALTGILIGVVGMILIGRTKPAGIFITPPPTIEFPEPTPSPSTIRVYVSGEVRQPDVYELPAGVIIRDVINAAGGFTSKAGQELINLALTVTDGMHIHVPAAGSEAGAAAPAVRSSTGSLAGEQVDIININVATLEQLDTLPGVGPGTAQKIIDYRREHGPFLTIEDIIDVSGIGPAKFEAMKLLISVD